MRNIIYLKPQEWLLMRNSKLKIEIPKNTLKITNLEKELISGLNKTEVQIEYLAIKKLNNT